MNIDKSTIEMDGIDLKDYPDFCDAYISYAEDKTGRPLTDEELEAIPSDFVYEQVWEWIT